MNKQRQRKLEARKRRLVALHSSSNSGEKDSVVIGNTDDGEKGLVTPPVVVKNKPKTSKTNKRRGRPPKNKNTSKVKQD